MVGCLDPPPGRGQGLTGTGMGPSKTEARDPDLGLTEKATEGWRRGRNTRVAVVEVGPVRYASCVGV